MKTIFIYAKSLLVLFSSLHASESIPESDLSKQIINAYYAVLSAKIERSTLHTNIITAQRKLNAAEQQTYFSFSLSNTVPEWAEHKNKKLREVLLSMQYAYDVYMFAMAHAYLVEQLVILTNYHARLKQDYEALWNKEFKFPVRSENSFNVKICCKKDFVNPQTVSEDSLLKLANQNSLMPVVFHGSKDDAPPKPKLVRPNNTRKAFEHFLDFSANDRFTTMTRTNSSVEEIDDDW